MTRIHSRIVGITIICVVSRILGINLACGLSFVPDSLNGMRIAENLAPATKPSGGPVFHPVVTLYSTTLNHLLYT